MCAGIAASRATWVTEWSKGAMQGAPLGRCTPAHPAGGSVRLRLQHHVVATRAYLWGRLCRRCCRLCHAAQCHEDADLTVAVTAATAAAFTPTTLLLLLQW
jgi:hypothetical protein